MNRPDLSSAAELTVIIVSYNTRDLTLRAIESLLENAGDVAMEVIVWDNASSDGSAETIASRFPEVELVAHPDNIGFSRANNAAAERANGDFILLLNPDTETHEGAIAALLHFAKAHPEAGITGGRTVYPDGSLNPTSCWNRMTVWSLFCNAVGLARAFPHSCLFSPEAIGCWKRDCERQVDIVTGCFLMIGKPLWQELGGFDETFFMYGEDADLCLRARKLGYRPRITPDAEIMHLVGASTRLHRHKIIAVMKARATLVRKHWSPVARPVGIGLLWLWGALRRVGSLATGSSETREAYSEIWSKRADWLAGY